MRPWRLPLVLLLLTLAGPGPVAARTGQAYVEGVALRRAGRSELSVSFRVSQAFEPRVLETLDAGLPVRFTYLLQLVRPRELARDLIVSEVRLERTLVKDNLKNRFRVTLGRGEDRDFQTLAEAGEVMGRVDGLQLTVPESSARSEPILLKIKAKLQKFQLPFHLHYLFAFVSYWDVETDWYVLELPRNLDTLP